jgi:hypothetical protein
MPTTNPKVSAYIPQHLFDRFKSFYEERRLSMSQAVAVIFAEYFEVSLLVDHSSELRNSSISQRLEEVERKLAQVSGLHSRLLSELEEKVDSLAKDIYKNLEVSGEPSTQLDSGLPLLEYIDFKATQGELLTELPKEDTSEVPVTPQNDLPVEIQPIAGLKLSELRFGLSKNTLAGVKRKMTPEEFARWTKEKDPDGIAWKYVESPVKGYVPAEDLPSKLKSKLLKWIEKNIQSPAKKPKQND